MDQIKTVLESAGFSVDVFIKALFLLTVGTILLGTIGRFAFGKRSVLNHSVSSAIGILFVYAATVVLYSAGANFHAFVAPLPFVSISADKMTIFSFIGADYTVICYELLSMIILAFLANLMDAWLPKGKRLFSWLFFRCLTVILAMALHLLVTWLFTTYLPQGLVTYSPVILLGLLILLLLVGALKILVGAVLATVNPLIGAFYTFFFATLVGKALTKAVLTTAILSALVFGLHYIGCSVISIANAALIAYIPLLIVLLVIWYVVGKLL